MKKDILAVRIGARERRLLDDTQKLLKLSRSAIVREAIIRYAVQTEKESKMTAAELMGPYLGKYDSGGKNLSEQTGKRYREDLRRKYRKNPD